jgi:hypothetical protein
MNPINLHMHQKHPYRRQEFEDFVKRDKPRLLCAPRSLRLFTPRNSKYEQPVLINYMRAVHGAACQSPLFYTNVVLVTRVTTQIPFCSSPRLLFIGSGGNVLRSFLTYTHMLKALPLKFHVAVKHHSVIYLEMIVI